MSKTAVRILAIVLAVLMLLGVCIGAISAFADSITPAVATGDTGATKVVVILFIVAFVAVVALVALGIIMKKRKKK